MTLTKEQIEHLANLARLAVTEDEKKKYAEQISSILEYFDQLQAVDTTGIEPLSQVFESENVVRSDEDRLIFSKEKVLACASEVENGQVKVKAVFEK